MMSAEKNYDANEASVSLWLQRLADPSKLPALNAIYGFDQERLSARVALLYKTLEAFLNRYGDLPVRIYRAPGRVNLRGMHVDTHGGYLNLMTHHREVILLAAKSDTAVTTLSNTNAAFHEMQWSFEEETLPVAPKPSWFDFISQPDVREEVDERRKKAGRGWTNYGIGAALRVAYKDDNAPPPALKIMVAGDLPEGAALSSSAALSITALLAYADFSNRSFTTEQLVCMEQDVEWYAGARVGMSDQTAILMGRPAHMLHTALYPQDFSLDQVRYLPFPEDLSLLVVNSHTSRNLSGAQRAQYAINRFAYSMALTVLREELLRAGMDAATVETLDRLSRITPEAMGGSSAIYRLLRNVPEWINLHALRERYALPQLDSVYHQYFGTLPPEERPQNIPLRGPLLFGITESARARQFPLLLERGDYEEAGQLMTVGHDADRLIRPDGSPYSINLDNTALERMAAAALPITHCPGWYGAGNPALDRLVDTACELGALGASLTGAGMAGAVVVLCRARAHEGIANGLRQYLQTPHYTRLAKRHTDLSAQEAAAAVVVNAAIGGAGKLCIP